MSLTFTDTSINGAGSLKVFTCNVNSSELISSGVPGRFQSSPNTMFIAQCTDGTGLFEINEDASALTLISTAAGAVADTDDIIDVSAYDNATLTETLNYIDGILSGAIQSVVGGNKITVDSSNPTNPIVNFDPTAPIGGGEWS